MLLVCYSTGEKPRPKNKSQVGNKRKMTGKNAYVSDTCTGFCNLWICCFVICVCSMYIYIVMYVKMYTCVLNNKLCKLEGGTCVTCLCSGQNMLRQLDTQ